MMSDATTCRHCRTQALRVEELEETVRQLKADLYGDGWRPPYELGLTAAEETILRTLYRHERTVSYEMLYAATRGIKKNSNADVDGDVIKVHLSKIRTKLRPYKIQIGTNWGRGYYLVPASRERLAHWHSEREAA